MSSQRYTENPFDDQQLVARYEGWYSGEGSRADELEKRLLKHFLTEFSEQGTLLEVGCGTGHFTRWFAGQGWRTIGLDVSTAILAEAKRLNGTGYVRGNALQLPFPDQSFDLVTMITTLEFLADPLRALREAARVARSGLLLGVLNRWSLLARSYRASGKSLWQSARFYSPFELKVLVRQASGQRLQRLAWRTTLWPFPAPGNLPLPWGGFIGLGAHLQNQTSPSAVTTPIQELADSPI